MKSLLIALGLVLALSGCNEEGAAPDVVVAKKECVSPLGGLLAHGEVVSAFKDLEVVKPQACLEEKRTCVDGVLSGSYMHKECVQKDTGSSAGGGGDSEPSTHEKPMKIDDKDLKVGGIKLMGQTSLYLGVELNNMPFPRPNLADLPQCAQNVQSGVACAPMSPCKIGTKVYTCESKMSYKVFGWVYEVVGRDFLPAEGVKADIYYFDSGSGAGGLMVGPVKTDKFGYFELLTPMLLNQVRLDGLDVGLYAFCSNGKPVAGGGSSINSEMVGKPFVEAFAHQKRIKPESCK